MKGFRISDTLTLPPDAVTQAIAALARKGAGKTYTGKVFAEEIIAAKVPTVILDPTGAWWGLRSSADGEKPGLPVTILGGAHGDVPLEPSKGVMVADVVIDYPGAYILDISAFESRRAEVIFAAAFLERLYRRKQPQTGPMMLIVDEADVFAPQRPGPEATKSLGALESIVRRGRIKGLGDMLLTQRAAVLNKNVLTQTECLIVLQTTGPQDRAAIREWIEGNADSAQSKVILDSLASLERGEAWVWSPSWLRKLVKIKVRQARTFDSSRTPEPGETIAPKAFAKVDLEKLGAEMAAAVEKAKADDPATLKARIRELERLIAAQKPVEKIVERIVEKPTPFLDPALRATVDGLVRSIRDALQNIDHDASDISSAMSRENLKHPPSVTRQVTRDVPVVPPVPSPVMAPTKTAAVPVNDDGNVIVTPTMKAVLNVLAQFDVRTQQQVAILSGYSPTSGGYYKALADLRKAGAIEGSSTGLRITSVGRSLVGEVEPLPADLLAYWTGRLKPTEAAVLKALADAHPEALPQRDVAEKSGYSPTSGGFYGALAKLRKLDLIDGSSTGLRITDDLMGGA